MLNSIIGLVIACLVIWLVLAIVTAWGAWFDALEALRKERGDV